MNTMTRRQMLLMVPMCAAASSALRAQQPVKIDVYKDPTCGCCVNWVAHLRKNGFAAHSAGRRRHRCRQARVQRAGCIALLPHRSSRRIRHRGTRAGCRCETPADEHDRPMSSDSAVPGDAGRLARYGRRESAGVPGARVRQGRPLADLRDAPLNRPVAYTRGRMSRSLQPSVLAMTTRRRAARGGSVRSDVRRPRRRGRGHRITAVTSEAASQPGATIAAIHVCGHDERSTDGVGANQSRRRHAGDRIRGDTACAGGANLRRRHCRFRFRVLKPRSI